MVSARLRTVLEVGQKMSPTGVGLVDKTQAKPASNQKSGTIMGPTGPRLIAPTAAESNAGTLERGKSEKAMVTGDGAYADWIATAVKEYEADRAQDLAKMKTAQAEALACMEAEEKAEAEFEAEVAKDADKIIARLAKELTEKIADYDMLQSKLDSGDTKNLALEAEKVEKDGEISRLEKELADCKTNAKLEAEAAEAAAALKAKELADKVATEMKEAADRIATLTGEKEALNDKLAKCGKDEQAQIDALQEQLVEKVTEYQKLHEEVCEMLKNFKIPIKNEFV
tara:strand:- start:480 stop:1331 length:852 start_codon:yes stop_codon:yes gene_type:complete